MAFCCSWLSEMHISATYRSQVFTSLEIDGAALYQTCWNCSPVVSTQAPISTSLKLVLPSAQLVTLAP